MPEEKMVSEWALEWLEKQMQRGLFPKYGDKVADLSAIIKENMVEPMQI